MTLADVTALIAATPEHGVCTLPGGTITPPDFSPLIVPRPMTIRGNGTVFRLPETGQPDQSFIQADRLPNGSALTIEDIEIHGPSTGGWDPETDLGSVSAISMQWYRTWDSRLTLRNVETSGGYSYGVSRSGGGRFTIENCALSGWVGGIAFFESHGGWGDMVVRDTTLHAPARSKYSSIGAYVHPHLHVTWERVSGSGWNRYLLYLNGSPQSAGHHTLVEVAAVDCSLIQTGSGSETTLIRCSQAGTPKNAGSFFKGDVVSVHSAWEGSGGIGFLKDAPARRRFVGDLFATTGYAMGASAGITGTIHLDACRFVFGPKTAAMTLAAGSNVEASITSPEWEGSTRFPANIEAGTLRLINADGFPLPRVIAPGEVVK